MEPLKYHHQPFLLMLVGAGVGCGEEKTPVLPVLSSQGLTQRWSWHPSRLTGGDRGDGTPTGIRGGRAGWCRPPGQQMPQTQTRGKLGCWGQLKHGDPSVTLAETVSPAAFPGAQTKVGADPSKGKLFSAGGDAHVCPCSCPGCGQGADPTTPVLQTRSSYNSQAFTL